MTLGTDIVATGIAVDFGSTDETATILKNVVIESEQTYAIRSLQSNSAVINHGNVISGASIAVFLDQGDDTVVNAAGAIISGFQLGVLLFGGGNDSLNNSGAVLGGQGTAVQIGVNATGASVTNHGAIVGGTDGILMDSGHVGGIIQNFGFIRGDIAAIDVAVSPGLRTAIDNAASGVLSGQAGVFAPSAAFSLTNAGKVFGVVQGGESIVVRNHGLIDGSVAGSTGSVVINSGVIQGPTVLTGSNSSFIGTGGISGPVFSAGGNSIIAGNGAARIHNLGGGDTVTGGPGADRFFFEHALGGAVDRITNFSPAHDKMVLSETFFGGIGPAGGILEAPFFIPNPAPTATVAILYDHANGFLFYDAGGKADPIHFATLANHPALTHTAFVVEA
jgi:hypothetical protein